MLQRLAKIGIFLSILLCANSAYATDHYFHNGGTGAMPCTIGDPCDNFSSTTYDNSGGITAGDNFYFNRGDEWNGSEALISVNSNCTAGSPCIFGAYGSGANPKFYGDAIYGGTWTAAGFGTNEYYTTGQSQTTIGTVTINDDNTKTLMRWTGNNNNLPAGHFCRSTSTVAGTACTLGSSGTNLFVRLWDGSDPTGQSPRIASYSPTYGLVGTAFTDKGDYTTWKDLEIGCSNGYGFFTNGYNTYTINLKVVGSRLDGYLLNRYPAVGGDSAFSRDYYSDIGGGASYGTGNGQGVTLYGGDNQWLIGTISHNNGMAGIDFLDYGTNSNVTQSGMIRTKSYNNALWSGSFDPSVYLDGASEIFIRGLITYGESATNSGNATSGLRIGTEHPSSPARPAENIWVMDSMSYGNHWVALDTYQTGTPNTLTNIWFLNNDLIGLNGSFEMVGGLTSWLVSGTHTIHFANNIFYPDDLTPTYAYMPTEGAAGATDPEWEYDYNQYYRRSGHTNIYGTGGNTCRNSTASSTCWDLARWRTNSGEEAHSAYGDPLFVTDSDTAPDVHLGVGSPALNTGDSTWLSYSPPAWLPSDLFPTTASKYPHGTTVAAGTLDDPATPDIGYHYSYGYLYPASVTSASLVASATTTQTISFTIADAALLYNWKIKILYPAGYTINSGGTTAIASISGFDGGTSLSVAGQNLTITRDGSGQSFASGAISFTLSNIANPTAGAVAGPEIQILDASNNIMATTNAEYGLAVTGQTITGAAVTGGHFSCGSGTILKQGTRIT